jgi:very-short-patch-repair endonuclease
MRSEQTLAEMRLWRELRGHRLAGLGFRRQVPMGRFIADFVCHEAKVVIEIDGGTHGTPAEVRYDRQREGWFAARGYRVMRFWNVTVREDLDSVIEAIRQACGEHGTPHPNPPPQGGRGPVAPVMERGVRAKGIPSPLAGGRSAATGRTAPSYIQQRREK